MSNDGSELERFLINNVQVKGMNELTSLLMLWMDENVSQQSKKLLMKVNLQLLDGSTTKQARTAPTWGIEAGALNR